MRALLRLYPLTLPGTLLFVAGVFLLAESYTSGNTYAFMFGAGGLLLLLLLASVARVVAFRTAGREISWDGGQAVFARAPALQHFRLGTLRLPPFFRLHVRLRGRLDVGRDTPLFLRTEAASSAGELVSVPLDFPLPGVLRAGGQLLARDIFGLVRAHSLDISERTILVRPPPFPVGTPDRFLSHMRDESKSRRTSGDDDKYYMRQYIPGDRLKDVNWKASVRTTELITRIAPESPERSQTFLVELRPFTNIERDDAEMLIHLSYARSWLFSFVRSVLSARPGTEFRIILPESDLIIRSASELDLLSGALAGVRFQKEHLRPTLGGTRTSQRFVFTTAYDAGLGRALAGSAAGTLTVFRTRPSGNHLRPRRVRFFSAPSADLLPGKWYLRKAAVVQPGQLKGLTVFEEFLEVARW